MSNRGLANKEKGREGHMDGMDAWEGREGVFVIERSPRDREDYMGGRSREVRAR